MICSNAWFFLLLVPHVRRGLGLSHAFEDQLLKLGLIELVLAVAPVLGVSNTSFKFGDFAV